MQSKRAGGVEEFVVARVFTFRHEAEIARGVLEADGIEAVIAADDCGGLRPFLGAASGGARLLVHRSDQAKANSILGDA